MTLCGAVLSTKVDDLQVRIAPAWFGGESSWRVKLVLIHIHTSSSRMHHTAWSGRSGLQLCSCAAMQLCTHARVCAPCVLRQQHLEVRLCLLDALAAAEAPSCCQAVDVCVDRKCRVPAGGKTGRWTD
jgi:hypothetical protein